MVTSQQCLKKYGEPSASNACMVLWDVPTELEIGIIPKKIYCNRDLIKPATMAFKNLIDSGCVNEIKTYDGCFNIRKSRGLSSMSLHSWGIALDFNAFSNPLGLSREQCILRGLKPFSIEFGNCFKSAGFDWGNDWNRKDLMHFQLKNI